MANSHSTEVLYLAAWQAHHQSEDTLAGGGLERDRGARLPFRMPNIKLGWAARFAAPVKLCMKSNEA